MKLVLTFTSRFSPRGSFILISIHGEMESIHMNTCFAKADVNSIGPFQSPSQGLKAFLLAAQWQVPLLFVKKAKLAEITTYCHSLSLAVVRCHSLPFIVPLVAARCHSLSFVVTHCHSLPLDLSHICLFINSLLQQRYFKVVCRYFKVMFYKCLLCKISK